MSNLQTHPFWQCPTKLLPSSPSPPAHRHLDSLAKSNGSAACFGSAPIAHQLLPISYQRALLFLLNTGHRHETHRMAMPPRYFSSRSVFWRLVRSSSSCRGTTTKFTTPNFSQFSMIPISAGSSFITAVYLDPGINPGLHLLQQLPRTPLLRWLGRRTIQLPTFRDLPGMQIQP